METGVTSCNTMSQRGQTHCSCTLSSSFRDARSKHPEEMFRCTVRTVALTATSIVPGIKGGNGGGGGGGGGASTTPWHTKGSASRTETPSVRLSIRETIVGMKVSSSTAMIPWQGPPIRSEKVLSMASSCSTDTEVETFCISATRCPWTRDSRASRETPSSEESTRARLPAAARKNSTLPATNVS